MSGFGIPGSGKTQFFGGDNNTIFASTEPGQDFVRARVVPIRDWNTFKYFVKELADQKKAGQLDCSSVTIDIVDNLHQLCMDAVSKAKGFAHPGEDVKGFGKTWAAVTKDWTGWLRALMDITNVRYITHCKTSAIEVPDEHGLMEELTRYEPTFSSGKAAQYLDGVVQAVGFFTKSKEGQHILTFKQDARTAAKDRTDILCKLGPIVLPSNPTEGFNHVANLYSQKANELGYKIQSK